MNKLFPKTFKHKTPQEIATKLQHGLEHLHSAANEREAAKAQEEVTKYLGYAKQILFGDDAGQQTAKHSTKESALELSQSLVDARVLSGIASNLKDLDFESRKDAAQVFGAVVRLKREGEPQHDGVACGPGARYVQQHPEILTQLFQGYDDTATALACGCMLQDCVRDAELARMVLQDPMLLEFFSKVEASNFEIASDAFKTFKNLLTRHKDVVKVYLEENYTQFFQSYTRLLTSDNYATRRTSLKLLGELLLDRKNVRVMVKYVSDVQNLKLMMNLLLDKSASIQFEAFHVFKVFVANPNKPQPIVDILRGNCSKLLKYLEDFHRDKDDEQFQDEKAVIIQEITNLGSAPPAAAAPQAPPSAAPSPPPG